MRTQRQKTRYVLGSRYQTTDQDSRHRELSTCCSELQSVNAIVLWLLVVSALEAITRQRLVKTQETERTQYVL
jgi:hypothetical protein